MSLLLRIALSVPHPSSTGSPNKYSVSFSLGLRPPAPGALARTFLETWSWGYLGSPACSQEGQSWVTPGSAERELKVGPCIPEFPVLLAVEHWHHCGSTYPTAGESPSICPCLFSLPHLPRVQVAGAPWPSALLCCLLRELGPPGQGNPAQT